MKYNSLLAAALAVAAVTAGAAPAGVDPHVNPLLSPSPLPFQYPPFDQIRDSDFGPALDQGMTQHLAEIEAIANSPAAPTFDNTIVAMERAGQLLRRANTVLGNLTGADTNPARQKLQDDYAAKLAAHSDEIFLNAKLYARIHALYEVRDTLKLDAESLRLLECYQSDFARAGAGLDAAGQARLKTLNGELATLQAQSQQNVLAEVNASALVLNRKQELAGLSAAEIAAAATEAKTRHLNGKYVLVLVNTTGQPLLAELQDRSVRERLFKASIARGSHGGKHDNRATFARIVALRAERAHLLGFESFAAYSLANTTAQTPVAVNALLGQLAPVAIGAATHEAADLQGQIDTEQAALKQPSFKLQPWDWAYYAGHLKTARYGLDESQIKPYFELKNVMENGVFYAANQLYGLTFKQRHDLPVYQKDVMVYDVYDADGKPLCVFIADMFARPSKQGGAWMSEYVSQSRLFGNRTVIANHLNVPKPPPGEPVLLTWDEVTTAFHEFGHALHGMFSNVEYPYFAGTAVPGDFGEYPSQFNEMWAAWPQVLDHYAHQYQTGAPMPQALRDKMIASSHFDQAFALTEELSASILDQRWHQVKAADAAHLPKAEGVMAFEAASLKDAGMAFEPVPPRYRTPYFSHMISGGYEAGYYAYLWSEVLAADTTEWFKANGGMTRANGATFRAKVLSQGYSQDPQLLFKNLVGHGPEVAPLLEKRGLNEAAN